MADPAGPEAAEVLVLGEAAEADLRCESADASPVSPVDKGGADAAMGGVEPPGGVAQVTATAADSPAASDSGSSTEPLPDVAASRAPTDTDVTLPTDDTGLTETPPPILPPSTAAAANDPPLPDAPPAVEPTTPYLEPSAFEFPAVDDTAITVEPDVVEVIVAGPTEADDVGADDATPHHADATATPTEDAMAEPSSEVAAPPRDSDSESELPAPVVVETVEFDRAADVLTQVPTSYSEDDDSDGADLVDGELPPAVAEPESVAVGAAAPRDSPTEEPIADPTAQETVPAGNDPRPRTASRPPPLETPARTSSAAVDGGDEADTLASRRAAIEGHTVSPGPEDRPAPTFAPAVAAEMSTPAAAPTEARGLAQPAELGSSVPRPARAAAPPAADGDRPSAPRLQGPAAGAVPAERAVVAGRAPRAADEQRAAPTTQPTGAIRQTVRAAPVIAAQGNSAHHPAHASAAQSQSVPTAQPAAPGNEGGFGITMVPKRTVYNKRPAEGFVNLVPPPSERGRGTSDGVGREPLSQGGPGAPRSTTAATVSLDQELYVAPGNEGGFGGGIMLVNPMQKPAAPGNAGGFDVKIVPKELLAQHNTQETTLNPQFADQNAAQSGVKVVKTDNRARPAAKTKHRWQRSADKAADSVPEMGRADRPKSVSSVVGSWLGLNDPYGGATATDANGVVSHEDFRQEPRGLVPLPPADADLITGKLEGMLHYAAFIQKEKAYNKQMGGRSYSTTRTRAYSTATTTKVSHETMVREELLSLPEFKPVFITAITFLQFVIFCGMVLQSLTQNQFAKWGLDVNGATCDGDCPLSANSTTLVGSIKIEPVNPWLGPTAQYLIKFNSKFSPCMRDDVAIGRDLIAQANTECCVNCDVSAAGSPFQVTCGDATYADSDTGAVRPSGYSCCAMPNSLTVSAGLSNNPQSSCESFFPSSGDFNGTKMVTTQDGQDCLAASLLFGMTSYTECESYNGVWIRALNTNVQCDETLRITLRPCCIGHKSECRMLTTSQCEFEAGISHATKQLCGQVPCLQETCSTYAGATVTGKAKPSQNDIDRPDQWYRFIAPIFIHAGVIQFLVVLYVQYDLGCPIETSVGWLRMGLIYFISGIGGYALSGTMDPYVVSCGANPSVFGMLALMTVELFQSWAVVPNKWMHFAKLFALAFVGFIVGSLPYVDNFAQLGGFLFGGVASIVFLPYVTLGKWHQRARWLLVGICAPLLFFMILVAIIMFYTVQVTTCSWCADFNCWQWHSSMSCDGR